MGALYFGDNLHVLREEKEISIVSTECGGKLRGLD